jgi:transcription initiation factor TFIIIB Brf1 subunit/transcription initiation factor TFIIB
MSITIDRSLNSSSFPSSRNSNKMDIIKTNATKSIADEFDKFPIQEHIKKKARIIYEKIGSRVHRGNKRKQLLFYCIYNAELEYRYEHPEIMDDVDPVAIHKMVGITRGSMRKAMSMFSETQTGYRPKTGSSNPLGLIRSYCEINHISDEMIEPIKQLGLKIIEKDSTLLEEYPQTVAAGLIKYGILSMGSGSELDNEVFSKNIGLSQATINSMYKRIAEIDNN